MKYLLIIILALSLTNFSYAAERASKERIKEVARMGAMVMPFDLAKTTHIFSKTKKGGIQEIIVKNTSDSEQRKLIRDHLTIISHEFSQGNFFDPTQIHGDTMPGLKTLKNAKPNQINIVYQDIQNGGKIIYSTNKPYLVAALHLWFNAQLKDHANDAVLGHTKN